MVTNGTIMGIYTVYIYNGNQMVVVYITIGIIVDIYTSYSIYIYIYRSHVFKRNI